jgi:elongation factor P
MVSTNDFKNGMTINLDGKLFNIIYFQHVKPGKGGAFVRTKLKNLDTGAVIDYTFRADEKVELAILDRREMQYLYEEGEGIVFMDMQTYEQMKLDKEIIGESLKLLKENDIVQVVFYKGNPVAVDVPTFVKLKVSSTPHGFKGDTVSAGTKPAVLETGAIVNVPMFIKEGDVIKVDTRSSEYVTRIS